MPSGPLALRRRLARLSGMLDRLTMLGAGVGGILPDAGSSQASSANSR